MHIAPHDNQNRPIVDAGHPLVPLNYFNIVTLKQGEVFSYAVPGYETCIVPATGTLRIEVGGQTHNHLGQRKVDVWDGEPEGVYVPTGMEARMTCQSDSAEVFIAGAKFDQVLEPFAVRADEIDKIQYGSDDTKTHRKIKHILGAAYHDRVGRLLVSELFTVGADEAPALFALLFVEAAHIDDGAIDGLAHRRGACFGQACQGRRSGPQSALESVETVRIVEHGGIDAHRRDRLLHRHHVVGREQGLERGEVEVGARTAGADRFDHPHFVGERGIADQDLQQEAVELGFRQRVGAFLLDRVLRGDGHERGGEREALAFDRHLLLLHGFEQGRLRLRRGAVDP